MAIKISNSTIIDDSRNIIDAANINVTGITTLGAISVGSTHNIRIGTCAGASLTNGANNFFAGSYAGCLNTSGSYNNFFGRSAGRCNTDGSSNNFFGLGAGCNNTTGTNNNFFGSFAGRCNTTGIDNTFIGNCAGLCNTIGGGNVFIGNCAGFCNTTGSCNNFFGTRAGRLNTTGTNNNFFGFCAGYSNANGSFNNFFGCYAGRSNTTGSFNNFFGIGAGCCNTIGSYNNFFGRSAGRCNTDGSYNNFFGCSAGRLNTTGGNNNFLGCCAGFGNTSGYNNNFLGSSAGYGNTNGSCNLFLGSYAGCTQTTGSNNVAIGHGAQLPIITGSNQLVIGSGNTSWINGNSSYNVGLGTANPTSKLHVVGESVFVGVSTNSSHFKVYNSNADETGLTVFPSGSYYTTYSRQLSPQVGTAITNKAVSPGCTRCTDAEVYNYFWNNYSTYDVDGDGVVSPNDAIIIQRYLFGGQFDGNLLISGITFPSNATRTTLSEIRSFIGIHSTTTYDVDGDGLVTPLGDALMIYRIVSGFSNPADGAPSKFVTNANYKVGVGIAVPDSKLTIVDNSSSAALRITQTGTGNALTVEDEANPDSTPFVVGAAGSVGIGTTNPTSKLHVIGDISASGSVTAAQFAGVGVGNSIQIVSGSKLVGLTTGSIIYPGSILQVIQTVKGDTFSVAPGANTFGTVTGLSASITPTSASSKILVTLDMYVGCSGYQVGIRLYRNGNFIGGGTPEGSRTAATWYHNAYSAYTYTMTYTCIRAGGMYLDSPASTSALTYTIGIKDYSTYTAYVNRSNVYLNTSDYDHNGISTITLMEVSA